MITLTTIFDRYGRQYRTHAGSTLLPQQAHAMHAIARCRTEALGGHVFTCPDCQTTRYSYHSCRNRHCPTCQQDAGQTWLTQQRDRLLPVRYFLVTFTIPAELRDLAQTHQRSIYGALFRASSTALQRLAADPRHLGGELGMMGMLQTWTRDLRYHPHIHYLVPAVALAVDGRVVQPPAADFLLPVRPLARLFRGTLRASLRQFPWARQIPTTIWERDWVVDCRPVGTGDTALKYLAPYVFRVALCNNRLIAITKDQVTFRYTHGETGEHRTSTVPVLTFIRRFLAHILPPGFVKVRYYGLLSPARRAVLRQIRARLALARGMELAETPVVPPACADGSAAPRCPSCGTRMVGQRLAPTAPRAPPVGLIHTA